MTEGPGQQPPQDPRSPAPEGGREVLEGRVIPSRSQAQRQYDAPPRQAPPHDDPRQHFAAPPAAGPGAGGGPQAPGSGPAWNAQEPPRGAVPQQQAPAAGQQGTAPRQAAQAPQGAPGPQPAGDGPQRAPGFGGQAAAFQERIARIREREAAEAAASAAPPRTAPSHRSSAVPPAGSGGAPDWNALAEQQAAAAARRRKVMMLTGGVVAVALIAGAVAAAVVFSGKSSDTDAGPGASGSTGASAPASLPPAPSFSSVAPPPPANPLDYLGTAAKDTAPLTPATLLPGKQFQMNGRTYLRTASTSTAKCSDGARDQVAAGLTANGCTQLIRATYTNGAVAVTVGVAVFADTAHAAKVQKTARYLAPLNGGGVKDFCHAVACQMTSNAVGRYAYFAISGLRNGKTLPPTDTVAKRAANEASNFAFSRIIQRGRDAAAADPARG